MARPRNADSGETQSRIVKAAREILEEGGPDAFSVRRVATKAGVSVGTLRYYFSTQEELVLEAGLNRYYDHLDQLKQIFFAQLTDRASAMAAVDATIAAGFRFCVSEATAHRVRVGVSLPEGRFGDEREARSRRPFLREFAEKMRPLTGLSHEDLRFACQSLMFMVSRYSNLDARELLDVFDSDSVEAANDKAEVALQQSARLMLWGEDERQRT